MRFALCIKNKGYEASHRRGRAGRPPAAVGRSYAGACGVRKPRARPGPFPLVFGLVQVHSGCVNDPKARHQLNVAAEVWIVTALLHREQPEREDFTVAEIVERARKDRLTRQLRPGVYVHAFQHGVSNRPPYPGRSRMLLETGPNRRRLYRAGDTADEARRGGKVTPARAAIPSRYHPLLDWYEKDYGRRQGVTLETDPLLALRGSGRRLWADEPPDRYVRRLREGWG